MKIKSLLVFLLLIIVCCAGCAENAQTEIFNVSEVKLNRENLYLKVGETSDLYAQVFPFNAHVQTINWESLDRNIAKVDNTGKVTAIKPGTTTINAVSVDGGYKSSCQVEVMENIMKNYITNPTNKIQTVEPQEKALENENQSSELTDGFNFDKIFHDYFEQMQNYIIKQQEFFNEITQKLEDMQNNKDYEIVEQVEEEYVNEDGFNVKVKNIQYKKAD